MGLKLKLQYQYQLVLSLNANAKMEDISKEIEGAKVEFNNKSQTAQTVKQILKADVENNLLLITLGSDKPLSSPSRALFVFTQSIINTLKENGRDEIITETVKRKGFFRSIGKPSEIKNIKAVHLDSEDKIDSLEALHLLLDIFSKENVSVEEQEVKSEIFKLLEHLKKVKEDK